MTKFNRETFDLHVQCCYQCPGMRVMVRQHSTNLSIRYMSTVGGWQYRLAEVHMRGESTLVYYSSGELDALYQDLEDRLKRDHQAYLKAVRFLNDHPPKEPEYAPRIWVDKPVEHETEPVDIPGLEDATVFTLDAPPASVATAPVLNAEQTQALESLVQDITKHEFALYNLGERNYVVQTRHDGYLLVISDGSKVAEILMRKDQLHDVLPMVLTIK